MAAAARAMAVLCNQQQATSQSEERIQELRDALDASFNLGGAPSVAATIAKLKEVHDGE